MIIISHAEKRQEQGARRLDLPLVKVPLGITLFIFEADNHSERSLYLSIYAKLN